MNSPDTLQNDAILHLFLAQLREQLGHHLKQVILFGSRARGDERPDSDYDCLAVVDRISPALLDSIDDIAGEFLYVYNIVFSVLPVSEERHVRQRHNPLFMNIEQEGVSL